MTVSFSLLVATETWVWMLVSPENLPPLMLALIINCALAVKAKAARAKARNIRFIYNVLMFQNELSLHVRTMFFDIVLNMQRYDFFLKYKKSFQKTTFEARMPPSTLRTRVPSGWKV